MHRPLLLGTPWPRAIAGQPPCQLYWMDQGMQIDVVPDRRRRIRAGQAGTARLNRLKYRCQPFGAFPSATALFCVVMATAGIAQMARSFSWVKLNFTFKLTVSFNP